MTTFDPDRPVLLPEPREVAWSGARASVATLAEPAVRVGVVGDLRPEGYRLVIGPDGGVMIDASDAAGAFYARSTLDQLRAWATLVGDGTVPCGTVTDWPDHAVRAVMLDISRTKVPTTATLRDLVARLASWKVNQIQLYTEHTFAYVGHEEVWRDASPITADELRELDAFCAEHHVELVPNQNGLGHMERWLRHDRYRPLALAPDGFEAFGRRRGASTLDPTNPDALALVRDLYGQLLPEVTSRRVNVGLDEPWELPNDRYADYVAWIEQLAAAPELAGRELLVWGDIVAHHPASAATLPERVTILEWGYDAGHPFEARAAALAAAGRPFWLCPGTSSWMTILGRVTNMRANIAEACDAAVAHGAAGLLVTDWGDCGHLQYLPISEPGFAWFAAQSWCRSANAGIDLGGVLSVHAFADPSGELAAALLDLGDAYLESEGQFPNLSMLTLPLYYPDLHVGRGPMPWATAQGYERVEAVLDGAAAAIARSHATRSDRVLVAAELANAIDLVRVLCDDGRARLRGDGSIGSVPAPERTELAAALAPVIDRHRDVWLARNRPGGLDESVGWLEALQQTYRTGQPQIRVGP